MMDRMEGLAVTGLGAGYPGRRIIQDLSLSPIAPGVVTALVGPNAAGKSTLLRALSGIIAAQGSILLDGVELTALDRESRSGLVGFMPQQLPAVSQLSLLESVLSGLRLGAMGGRGGLSTTAAEHRAVAVLERLGVADLALETLDALSGGQRQLANLAQTMVRDPRLLLLDEPTSALDMRHQVRVMKAVRHLADTGHVVVMVLHDLAFAARWADRIVVLGRGRVVAEGAPAAVITSVMLAEVYGVRARVETCSAGFIQIAVDDLIAPAAQPIR